MEIKNLSEGWKKSREGWKIRKSPKRMENYKIFPLEHFPEGWNIFKYDVWNNI